ncbi:MAG: hypothetical protein QFE16_04660 [Pseudomonadota bacterium]|nr:hypothetical protein [Pseudomonadota bacterium]
MRNAVFIHTNPKQIIGALVGRHALVRNSSAPERFDIRILQTPDFPALERFEGRRYLREGKQVVWHNDDLQSFTPLRFAVPEQMGYVGRAVLTDPDVFAIADINELLERDMGGAAVMARPMAGDTRSRPDYASSVMLMDCARLTHWHWEADFEKVFRGEHDYRDWNWLRLEPDGSVAPLEPQWNDFDRLESDTRMLHNTQRRTQPWKSGLPVDFTLRGNTLRKRISAGVRRVHAVLTGSASPAGHYVPHPDPAQERLFFRLLGECLEQGSISESMLRSEIDRRHVRTDAFDKAREAMNDASPRSAPA